MPADVVICKYCLCPVTKPQIQPDIHVCPCPCHWQASPLKAKLIEVVVTYYPDEVRRALLKQGGNQA